MIGRPFANGEFGFHGKDRNPEIARALPLLRQLLDDPASEMGTLEGRTAAAVRGARMRAVHRDVVDTMDGDPGSFIDLGIDGAPALRIRANGPDAPLMDIADPRAGMRRLLDLVADGIGEGIVRGVPTDAARLRDVVVPIVLSQAIARGDPWHEGCTLELHLATPLAPFGANVSSPGVVRTLHRDVAPLIDADDVVRTVAGGYLASPISGEDAAPSVLLKPYVHHVEYRDVGPVDAMDHLRARAALAELR